MAGRDGSAPTRRSVSRCASALLVLLGLLGCAHRTAPAPKQVPDVEVSRLRMELAAREQTIQQLEGRLALAEAAQRQLAGQLALARGDGEGRTESVRIGARAPEPEPASEPLVAPPPEPSGRRPLLRLHTERRVLTSTWTPPVTGERLEVVPLPRPRGEEGVAPEPAAKPPPSHVGASHPGAEGERDLYVRALDLVHRRAFRDALDALDAFLKQHPDDPRAVRALFWRGEILFAERAYAKALSAFEQALQRAPAHDKAANALLRVALCHVRLGAPERARAAITELRTRFPQSEAAHLADQVIQQEDT